MTYVFDFGELGFVDSEKCISPLESIPKHVRYSSG